MVLHDRLKGHTLFKLCVILDEEVLEVELSDINIFVSIVHVLSQLLSKTVKDDPRLVVVLFELLFQGFDELFGEFCRWAGVNCLDDRHALLK